MINTVTYTLDSNLCCALMYGDYSGLEELEGDDLQTWIDENNILYSGFYCIQAEPADEENKLKYTFQINL